MKRKIFWAIVLAAFAGISWQALRALGEIDKHPGKVWLHRCNSLEKLQEKHAEYPNFEVDLVYHNDGVFDVTHDSLESINLNFAAYLENVQKRHFTHMARCKEPYKSQRKGHEIVARLVAAAL